MKEIKFRGWKVDLKRMFSAEEMAADQLCLLTTGRFINVHQIPKLSVVYDCDKFLPMQFTGLHDKNGAEIYEGDILKLNNEWDEPEENQVVKWFGPMFPSFDLSPGIDSESHNLMEVMESGCYAPVVIGNIHENPELLGGIK